MLLSVEVTAPDKEGSMPKLEQQCWKESWFCSVHVYTATMQVLVSKFVKQSLWLGERTKSYLLCVLHC